MFTDYMEQGNLSRDCIGQHVTDTSATILYLVQCNVDYQDLIYPALQLSGLSRKIFERSNFDLHVNTRVHVQVQSSPPLIR